MSYRKRIRTKGTTIQKLTILFFVTWLILALTIWFTDFQTKKDLPDMPTNSTEAILLKEAQLVEHFCLSRIPPTGGTATVPRAWEEALKSEIKLVDNVGELSSLSAEITTAAAKIKELQPGKYYAFSDSPGHTQHHLIYRSSANPNFMLSISKNDASLSSATKSESGMSKLWIIIARAAFASLLVTLAAWRLFKPSVQSA